MWKTKKKTKHAPSSQYLTNIPHGNEYDYCSTYIPNVRKNSVKRIRHKDMLDIKILRGIKNKQKNHEKVYIKVK